MSGTIDILTDASGDAEGSVGAGAQISIQGENAGESAGCAVSPPSSKACIPAAGFISTGYSFVIGLVPLVPAQGVMAAGGTIDAFAQSGTFRAFYSAAIDPTIEIDPSFPFRDDFHLVFSSNLFSSAPSAVALPPTSLLALAGAAVLALSRRFRRREPTGA